MRRKGIVGGTGIVLLYGIVGGRGLSCYMTQTKICGGRGLSGIQVVWGECGRGRGGDGHKKEAQSTFLGPTNFWYNELGDLDRTHQR